MRDNVLRIAIVGSNGLVGSEVTLLLKSRNDVDVRPLVRTRSGSSFLRYNGVPVVHCSITDPKRAVAALDGSDVVANFALAGGTPAKANLENEEIIRATFDYSPKDATIVFFSTLAVNGSFDEGRRVQNTYGDLKLRNERQVLSLAKKLGRKAFVLRLGHVAGNFQPISFLIRDEIMSPPVAVPEPERASNVTHTVTIADALIAIGHLRAGPPGAYDLLNLPQWSWRKVYEKEASDLGAELKLESLARTNAAPPSLSSVLRRRVFDGITRLGLRGMLMRIAAKLPDSTNEIMRAEFFVNRARSEIAALCASPTIRNVAARWPSIEGRPLSGLTPTHELFASKAFSTESGAREPWPEDLTT